MKNKSSVKILVVGDPGSIHTARFVSLLQEIGYEVRVFQSEYYYNQDEHLRKTLVYVAFPLQPPLYSNTIIPDNILIYRNRIDIIAKLIKGRDISIEEKKFPRYKHMIRVIKKYSPDLVISLKMPNDAYTVAETKEVLKDKFPKWLHFTWGTDIEFFGKNPKYKSKHLPKIKKVLDSCDFFLADSWRDVKQVSKFGFKGENLGMVLATGGFDIEELKKIKKRFGSQEKKIILVKGRQGGLVGKAFNVLKSLDSIRNDLKDYQIKIIMASPEVKMTAEYLNLNSEPKFEIVSRLSYKKLLELFSKSKIAISASDVDGSPLFLMEAMALGAFPIHSDMESVREWVENGKNGLLFPVDDIEKLTKNIKETIANNKLVDNARKINWQITKDRMDRNKIRVFVEKIMREKILGNVNEKKE